MSIEGRNEWVDELLRDNNLVYEDDEAIDSLTFQEPQANHIDDSVPYEGKVFNSDDEAYNFYCLFARKNGFSIRRHHVYKSIKNQSEDNPLGVYKREFVCHRAGIISVDKDNEVEGKRKRKSSRCSCGAKLLVNIATINSEKKWVVKYFNNNHNHELLNDKEVKFLPAYRSIPAIDQDRILLLSKAGCSVSLIIRVLELEKNVDEGNLPFLDKDIRNFIQSQSGIGKEFDASNVLKLCKNLKDADNAFEYEFSIDENNKLEHIIWAFGDSIRAYEAFRDVIVFDTTYQINRYDMLLGILIGVDNHGNSIFFGCVLLQNEKIPSFTWAIKTFLSFVKGKYPQTILTDQDLAMKEAIAMELPNTKHAFCIWHILAKLPTWFSLPLGSRCDDFKDEFNRLYHLECEDDFEREWKLMVEQFCLSKDNHIYLLYSLRQFWALAYLKDFFFAGMTTTGRSESINSYIKRFLGANTSLTDFINQVGVAVNIRNQAGEEARMRQKYHNPRIRTCFPIEEHAASILTPYAFKLIQHEIELFTKYAATETNNSVFIVRHHTKSDGGRFVSWIQENESIHCSCKEFEFPGILCRHAFRVLVMKNYFTFLSKYLPLRWRQESSLIPKSSHMINNNGGSLVKFRSLIQCLEIESLKTKEREQAATRESEKAIQVIKAMPEIQEKLVGVDSMVPDNDE